MGSSTAFPEEKTQLIYSVIQQTFPPAVKGMVHAPLCEHETCPKYSRYSWNLKWRKTFWTQLKGKKTSKKQQKSGFGIFCSPCKTSWSLINECVKCAFPVRIKIDLVFLTTAYNSECGKVTTQNPLNHQHLCTGDKAAHEKGEKELFRLLRQSVPHINALSLICVGFVCHTEWGQ